jgi:hypothetical protein
MSIDALEKVVNENTIPFEVAEKYLTLYVSKIDWNDPLKRLWSLARSKYSSEKDQKDFMKKTISCATLLPWYEDTTIPDPPENLLFWCTGWAQFNEKDWFDLYKKNVKEDISVIVIRNKVIVLGVIDPIDLCPLTRQAFNWLYGKAKDSGDLTVENADEIKMKFSNLVKVYGGAVICNIFANHRSNIENVHNWKSGYFFEKEIIKVYTLEKILKIKNMELQKVNQKYIKKISS